MSLAFDKLLQQHSVWKRSSKVGVLREHLPTGFPELDNNLPGGGWPVGALTEILLDREGIGELRLVISALASLSRDDRWIVWIAPPYIPYAPALSRWGVELSRVLLVRRDNVESLWAAEQVLRTKACGAMLLWHSGLDERSLRRLQLAAEFGSSLGVVFRPKQDAAHSSPAALRLRLAPCAAEGLMVWVLKCRGGTPDAPLHVNGHESHRTTDRQALTRTSSRSALK